MLFDETEVCEIKTKRREIQYINIAILYGDMILTLSDQKFSLTNENF